MLPFWTVTVRGEPAAVLIAAESMIAGSTLRPPGAARRHLDGVNHQGHRELRPRASQGGGEGWRHRAPT